MRSVLVQFFNRFSGGGVVMEEELKERLEILFGRFLNNEEEFTIGYLKQAVELSGKVCNLFLKIHNFVQEKIREGLVVNTGRKEQGGSFTVYIKKDLFLYLIKTYNLTVETSRIS